MDTAPQIVTHLAPEGRHVYSTRNTPNTKAPAGRQVNREARKLEREQAKLDP